MQFLWLSLWKGKYSDFLRIIEDPQKPTLVFTPNPEMLLGAMKDPSFLQILSRSDYLVPDGNGLYVASEMQNGQSYLHSCYSVFRSRKKMVKKYGELIKGSDLTQDIVTYVQAKKKNILIIDNFRITKPLSDFEKRKMKIQSEIIPLFHEKFPDLSVQVFFIGEMSPDAIAHHIGLNHIDYVFACSGMKSQEKILTEIFSYLPDTSRVVWLAVGSSFDYLLGLQKRAPLIFQKLWLEWLYRLIIEPRRRWRRIIDAVWRFPESIKQSKI